MRAGVETAPERVTGETKMLGAESAEQRVEWAGGRVRAGDARAMDGAARSGVPPPSNRATS